MFSGVRELETGFGAGASQLDGVKLNLEVFELDTGVSVFKVEVTVSVHFLGKPPIVVDEEGIVK